MSQGPRRKKPVASSPRELPGNNLPGDLEALRTVCRLQHTVREPGWGSGKREVGRNRREAERAFDEDFSSKETDELLRQMMQRFDYTKQLQEQGMRSDAEKPASSSKALVFCNTPAKVLFLTADGLPSKFTWVCTPDARCLQALRHYEIRATGITTTLPDNSGQGLHGPSPI